MTLSVNRRRVAPAYFFALLLAACGDGDPVDGGADAGGAMDAGVDVDAGADADADAASAHDGVSSVQRPSLDVSVPTDKAATDWAQSQARSEGGSVVLLRSADGQPAMNSTELPALDVPAQVAFATPPSSKA